MELKPYQQRVIDDLNAYMRRLMHVGDKAAAFNDGWAEKVGRYNPLSGTGMRPYQDNVPAAPHLCVKVPTAGGKTFIAINALKAIYDNAPADLPRVVLWLVPWSNLLQQTVRNLSDPAHPYRHRLNLLFQNRVAVLEKDALLQGTGFNPVAVRNQLTIVVMSFASLRARRKEDRKVYQENGQLAQWADVFADDAHQLKDHDPTAAINVIRHLTPVVVVDESHNAESELSVKMLVDLNPAFILDLTATPKENSNIISMVPALELKKEHMVKLPVIVHNLHDKTEVVQNALDLQRKLEVLATEQHKAGGRYIRPIVLFQAEPRTSDDNTTFEKLKQQLLKLKIPEARIMIKTAARDELKGIDLMDPKCPVRYIITVNALKEGWDCPFAYILASLANRSSAVDVEQILGRVLRLPYVSAHQHELLNMSYVLTASTKFQATLEGIVKGLQQSGFSEHDYRAEDLSAAPLPGSSAPSPELDFDGDEIDAARVHYDPEGTQTAAPGSQVEAIAAAAAAESKALQAMIDAADNEGEDPMLTEMPGKVKGQPMREEHTKHVRKLKLPQFVVKVPGSLFTGEEESWQPLGQELLLHGFDLAKEDTKIDFDAVDPELASIDVTGQTSTSLPIAITRISGHLLNDPQVQYLLSQPHESRIGDVAHGLMQAVGGVPPIADQHLVAYIKRVMAGWDGERIKDAIVQKPNYAGLIRQKVRALADAHAEAAFRDKVQLGTIRTERLWGFKRMLVPGELAPPLTGSLYDREGAMGEFESKVVQQLGGLPNIAWWHRNLTRGKGFPLNGFKYRHYPDFILGTTSGRILLIEAKGDDRDNSDSEAKARLGREWQNLSGTGFRYFMVFDKRKVNGAFTLAEARKLVGEL